MSEYGQFCPVAKAAEVFAERWTPLVLRELLSGCTRFSEIQRGVPLMSPSLLTRRLKELEDAGIVERHRPKGSGGHYEYRLTQAGEELRPVVMALGEWGMRWTDSRLSLADYDPSILLWDMRRRIRHRELPDRRVVIQFSFPDSPRGKGEYWLVIEGLDVDLCLSDPGFEPDLYAAGPVRTWAQVWLGKRPLKSAIAAGEIEVSGVPGLVRRFDRLFELSVFAERARSA
jgi:DNA-binding HxlR family transcriptional regulator/putative sterol carrier protein